MAKSEIVPVFFEVIVEHLVAADITVPLFYQGFNKLIIK